MNGNGANVALGLRCIACTGVKFMWLFFVCSESCFSR